ncbi:MAG: hypothetical protein VYA20_02200 [Candidatus Neomarinimicrobiota bacterium]|nr:hypothetical protein [Candidatus Neomarinimicrobiota bacterium]
MKDHLKNTKKVKDDILTLAEFLEKKEYEIFTQYLEDKYKKYSKSFIDIFDPSKKIEKDMEYFSDVRTLSKYNENLISGWLVEDFFIYIFSLPIFNQYGFSITLDSHDSDRVIKKKREYISSDPDFTVEYRGQEYTVEIQSLLIPYGKFHIKKNKADRLLSQKDSFLYHLNLQNQEIVYFYPSDIEKYGKLTKIWAFGGKKGYEYVIDKMPKGKKIYSSTFIERIIITLYWFYYYKELGEEEFNIFRDSITKKNSDVSSLLNHLKTL